jgi:hypothetical protein
MIRRHLAWVRTARDVNAAVRPGQLKRRLSDAVFQALLHDQTAGLTLAA